MAAEVIRFADYEQRSREPDAAHPRNPADAAVIIVLPVIRIERYDFRMEQHDDAIAPVMGRPMRPGRLRRLIDENS
jgi:hypothetical protein